MDKIFCFGGVHFGPHSKFVLQMQFHVKMKQISTPGVTLLKSIYVPVTRKYRCERGEEAEEKYWILLVTIALMPPARSVRPVLRPARSTSCASRTLPCPNVSHIPCVLRAHSARPLRPAHAASPSPLCVPHAPLRPVPPSVRAPVPRVAHLPPAAPALSRNMVPLSSFSSGLSLAQH